MSKKIDGKMKNFSPKWEYTKRKQMEKLDLKNTTTENEHLIDGIESKVDKAEQRVN